MKLPVAVVRAAARWRPAVPDGLLEATLDVVSVVTAAPITVAPRWRRAVVVAPHPDDETIGCGGTIAAAVAAGCHVELVLCTDGEATIGSPYPPVETARRRRAEAQAAATRLGVAAVRPLGLPDGRLSAHLPALTAALERAIRTTRAEVVFAPWVLERHPDHRAVPAALARVAAADLEVWGYEAHTPLHATHVLPLDADALAAKRAALDVHAATAGLAFDLDATLGLARWRSLAARAGSGHAEAFHVVPLAALRGLVERTAAAWDDGPVSRAAGPAGPAAPLR